MLAEWNKYNLDVIYLNKYVLLNIKEEVYVRSKINK
jgi:hypothetical protein